MSDLTPRTRLLAFAAVLAVVFGVGFGAGTLGAEADDRPPVTTTTPEGSDHDVHG